MMSMLIILKSRISFIVRLFFLLCFLVITACATVPRERVFNDFIIIMTETDDTFVSLSEEYLKDREKGWLISEFNNITNLVPGREVIIPLAPFKLGGLKANGYQTIPVLAYSGFSRKKAAKLTVTAAEFKRQMKFLSENGYRVITLNQFLDFIEFKKQIPDKSVLITFDDGRHSIYDIAFPILKGYGFPATLFVSTDFIGKKGAMSWSQINVLSENNFDIQCKIKTPLNMAGLKTEKFYKKYFKDLQTEISGSKKIIKKRLNRECRYPAYSHGELNCLVVAVEKKEGYCAAFTAKRGSNPFFVNNYEINRSVIHGGYDLKQFKKNLSVFRKSNLK